MGTIIEKSITIQAKAADVFTFAMQMEKWPEWYVGLHSMTDFSGPNQPGTTYVAKFDMAGITTVDFKGEVLTLETNKRWKGQTKGVIDSISSWEYVEDGDSTTVSVHVDYTLKGSLLGKLADKLFVEGQTSKDLQKSLENLKAAIEG